MGGSTATPSGYDAANMAEDIHQLAEHSSGAYLCLSGTISAGWWPTLRPPLFGDNTWSNDSRRAACRIGSLGRDSYIARSGISSFHPDRRAAGKDACRTARPIYFRYFLGGPHFAMLTWPTTPTPMPLPKNCALSSSSTALFPEECKVQRGQRSPRMFPLLLAAGENHHLKYVPAIAQSSARAWLYKREDRHHQRQLALTSR